MRAHVLLCWRIRQRLWHTNVVVFRACLRRYRDGAANPVKAPLLSFPLSTLSAGGGWGGAPRVAMVWGGIAPRVAGFDAGIDLAPQAHRAHCLEPIAQTLRLVRVDVAKRDLCVVRPCASVCGHCPYCQRCCASICSIGGWGRAPRLGP